MTFYTNVLSKDGKILYRGYEDGSRVKKKINFQPTLFKEAAKQFEDSTWVSLDGKKLREVQYASIKEAYQDKKMCEDLKIPLWGNTRFVSQFIQKQFPGNILFQRDLIQVVSIDIETRSDNGFPNVETGDQEILSIALKNNKEDCFHLWCMKAYDETNSSVKAKVEVHQFVNEKAMLMDFLKWWFNPKNTPDIVTGWNSRLFDVAYLYARIRGVLGEELALHLSPWKMCEEEKISFKGRSREATFIDLLGISQLDYLDLFKKFTTHTYGNQESYKLSHIAKVVLGDDKIQYDGTLQELYDNDPQTFFNYNLKDVELIERFEDKLGLITLALTIAYIGGVNYIDTLGTTAIWDSIIYRDLCKRNVTIPAFIEERKRVPYPGGYVKDVAVGKHNWVCSFDVNSMYPNLFVQYNMSPETIIGGQGDITPGIDPDMLLSDKPFTPVHNNIMAANGVHFRSDVQGVIPRLVDEIYNQRVSLKQSMLTEKKKLETLPKSDKEARRQCEREISRLENHQIAVKILLNSLYGACGNIYFRYFDLRVAEGITLTGQTAIRAAEKAVNAFMNKTLKTEGKDYVIAIDTDSLYVSMDKLVQKFDPKNPCKFLDEFCKKAVEPVLEEAMQNLATKTFCPKNRMVMKREAIADRAIWTAKKHYILNVLNNEGVQYAEPKIKMMGIEAVKSSTPEICRDEMGNMFRLIMSGTEEDVKKALSEFRSKFMAMPVDEISFPRGISDIEKWMPRNKKQLDEPSLFDEQVISNRIYEKGTPIHVRGALLYNNLVRKNRLTKKYPLIREGDKIKFVYLAEPNPIHENVISFPESLPKEFKLDNFVDREVQFEKTFLDPLDPIFKAIRMNPTKEVTLEQFFT